MLHFSICARFILSQCTISTKWVPIVSEKRSTEPTARSYNQDVVERDESVHTQSKSGSDIFRTERFSRGTRHTGSRIIGWKVCETVWSFMFLQQSFLQELYYEQCQTRANERTPFYAFMVRWGEMIPLNERVGGLSPKITLCGASVCARNQRDLDWCCPSAKLQYNISCSANDPSYN